VKTAAELYGSLQRAGITKQATWAPVSGPAVTAPVRFRDRTVEAFQGALLAFEASAQFPVTSFEGIAQGAALTIALESGPRTYKVRELHLISEGREHRAMLGK
jgi:hypothetical protein